MGVVVVIVGVVAVGVVVTISFPPLPQLSIPSSHIVPTDKDILQSLLQLDPSGIVGVLNIIKER